MASTWTLEKEGDALVFTVDGHISGDEARDATYRFIDLAADEETFVFEVRLHDLTGYETEARVLWTDTLRSARAKVSLLRIVGVKNPLIRMAATAVGLAAGVKMELL